MSNVGREVLFKSRVDEIILSNTLFHKDRFRDGDVGTLVQFLCRVQLRFGQFGKNNNSTLCTVVFRHAINGGCDAI